jgi:hypothetical protein
MQLIGDCYIHGLMDDAPLQMIDIPYKEMAIT